MRRGRARRPCRSEEHTSELQSPCNLVCRLLLEKKKIKANRLISLTTSIGYLSHLEKLDMRWNQLSSLPEWLQRLEQRGCTVFFFFLMIRRPPRSTPFPTRRSSDPRHATASATIGPSATTTFLRTTTRSSLISASSAPKKTFPARPTAFFFLHLSLAARSCWSRRPATSSTSSASPRVSPSSQNRSTAASLATTAASAAAAA